MWADRTEEMKEQLIKNVSKTVADTINTPIDHITVIINDVLKKVINFFCILKIPKPRIFMIPKVNWGLEGNQAYKL